MEKILFRKKFNQFAVLCLCKSMSQGLINMIKSHVFVMALSVPSHWGWWKNKMCSHWWKDHNVLSLVERSQCASIGGKITMCSQWWKDHNLIPLVERSQCAPIGGKSPCAPIGGKIPLCSHWWKDPPVLPLVERSPCAPIGGKITLCSHWWKNHNVLPPVKKSWIPTGPSICGHHRAPHVVQNTLVQIK